MTANEMLTEAEVDAMIEKAYQTGRADMLNEIIEKRKKGFIDKINLEFSADQLRSRMNEILL